MLLLTLGNFRPNRINLRVNAPQLFLQRRCHRPETIGLVLRLLRLLVESVNFRFIVTREYVWAELEHASAQNNSTNRHESCPCGS